MRQCACILPANTAARARDGIIGPKAESWSRAPGGRQTEILGCDTMAYVWNKNLWRAFAPTLCWQRITDWIAKRAVTFRFAMAAHGDV